MGFRERMESLFRPKPLERKESGIEGEDWEFIELTKEDWEINGLKPEEWQEGETREMTIQVNPHIKERTANVIVKFENGKFWASPDKEAREWMNSIREKKEE